MKNSIKQLKYFTPKLSLCSTFTKQYKQKREKINTRFRRNSAPSWVSQQIWPWSDFSISTDLTMVRLQYLNRSDHGQTSVSQQIWPWSDFSISTDLTMVRRLHFSSSQDPAFQLQMSLTAITPRCLCNWYEHQYQWEPRRFTTLQILRGGRNNKAVTISVSTTYSTAVVISKYENSLRYLLQAWKITRQRSSKLKLCICCLKPVCSRLLSVTSCY